MNKISVAEAQQAGCENKTVNDAKKKSVPASIPATLRINRRSGEFSLTVSLDPQSVIDAAKQIIARQFKRHLAVFNKPAEVKDFLLLNLAPFEREVFACLFLDNHYRLIAFETLFYGSIRDTRIHFREIIKRALHLNAAALVVAHNHPSGSCQPSEEDIRMTYKLNEALCVADIELLDHFIVGGKAVLSMAEKGFFDPAKKPKGQS